MPGWQEGRPGQKVAASDNFRRKRKAAQKAEKNQAGTENKAGTEEQRKHRRAGKCFDRVERGKNENKNQGRK